MPELMKARETTAKVVVQHQANTARKPVTHRKTVYIESNPPPPTKYRVGQEETNPLNYYIGFGLSKHRQYL